jgi:hypothetical protein
MSQLRQSIWLANSIPNGTPACANIAIDRRLRPDTHAQTPNNMAGVRENGSRIHGIESAVLVNADGAAARIRVARSPPHLTPPPQERIRDNHRATTSAKKTLCAVALLGGGPKQ